MGGMKKNLELKYRKALEYYKQSNSGKNVEITHSQKGISASRETDCIVCACEVSEGNKDSTGS